MNFLKRFRQAVASGALKADASQEAAARMLHALSRALARYRRRGLLFFLRPKPPRGLYLWGDVGRGKSMLMDMFFERAAVRLKRRVHFNAFMGEIHAHLNEIRREGRESDHIKPVAQRIAEDVALLCFDEFQVTDVADAMILGRLFEQLFARGVVVVATSNTEPDRLYQGGLNRQLFLPFVALIKEKMTVVSLNGDRDYRSNLDVSDMAYFTPLGSQTDAAMDEAWRQLTGGAAGKPAHLRVLGRRLHVPCAAGNVARFAFVDLCAAALGAADYLAVTRAYHTVLIDHIPAMKPEQRDQARRFTLLIDTLYDESVRLVCSAEVPAEQLYPEGEGADAFQRTVSRLLEMQSHGYIAKAKR
ncbi:MAG: AFG1 family ATPase [Alphaproteobacteria bacterium]|nr:AFG1 family ATPase [Alphaproteobacteria bacterium]MDE2493290.1 AFG1 family ATPase [Alphaproteobacteria bacterium]